MSSGVCVQCGASYTPRATSQRFCSKPCAGKWQWRGHTPRPHNWGRAPRPSVDNEHRKLRKQLLPDALGTPCPLCNVIMDKTAQLDHIIARAQGGPTTRANCRIICRECNSKRGSRLGGRVAHARSRTRTQTRTDTPATATANTAPRRQNQLPRW